jgi:hypothetical protein
MQEGVSVRHHAVPAFYPPDLLVFLALQYLCGVRMRREQSCSRSICQVSPARMGSLLPCLDEIALPLTETGCTSGLRDRL